MSLIEMIDVTYKYDQTNANVLKGITANFEAGKLYAIIGRSGSGKSTLISLLAGLDVCSHGKIIFNGVDLKDQNRDKYRAKHIGVIFQDYNLLTNAKGIDNVLLSMDISGYRCKDKIGRAYEVLEKLGIERSTAKRKIRKLSGGEQQRIGIASALSHDVDLLIADEPTSNLDSETENSIIQILSEFSHKENKCVVMVTHSKNALDYADQIWRMHHGKLSLVHL